MSKKKTITREELVSNYKIALKKRAQLEEKKYDYKVVKKFSDVGYIQDMTIDEVLKSGAAIHNAVGVLETCAKLYGITKSDLKNGNLHSYDGYDIDDWDRDFKMRVEEIHDERMLDKYDKVIEIFEKNFTEDDRYALDMSKVSELDVDLEDDEPEDEEDNEPVNETSEDSESSFFE